MTNNLIVGVQKKYNEEYKGAEYFDYAILEDYNLAIAYRRYYKHILDNKKPIPPGNLLEFGRKIKIDLEAELNKYAFDREQYFDSQEELLAELLQVTKQMREEIELIQENFKNHTHNLIFR